MSYGKNHRILTGLIFIAAAIIFLIRKLGFFGNINMWSLVITIFLLLIIIKSIRPLNFAGILFPIAFLGIIYSDQIGINALTPWTLLLTAALGTIGLSIIFNNKYHSDSNSKNYEFTVIDKEDESNIIQKTSFSGITKYINSDDFKQADLDCSFGAMEIYFDKADIKDGKAIVRIKAFCSGIELFVPKEWTIENQIMTTIGGVDTKNKNLPDGSATLVLIGDMTLSGLTITFI